MKPYGRKDGQADEINALEDQADELIDAGRFDEALDLCHRIIREHGPTFVSLDYIGVCEDLLRIAHREAVVKAHPDGHVAALSEIDALMKGCFRQQAHDRCTSQIDRAIWTSAEKLEFRIKRLQSVITGSIPRHFFEDIAMIAELRLGTVNDKIIIEAFANMVVKIQSPSFIEPLRRLGEKFGAFEKLAQVIRLKVQELEVLEQIRAEAGRWQR